MRSLCVAVILFGLVSACTEAPAPETLPRATPAPKPSPSPELSPPTSRCSAIASLTASATHYEPAGWPIGRAWIRVRKQIVTDLLLVDEYNLARREVAP